MTSTGLVLIPLALLVACGPPGPLLVAIFVATIFADAAVANPGGRSIAVAWFVAVLVIGRVSAAVLSSQDRLRADILAFLFPLVLFVLCCVISLLLALAIFQGQVLVMPGSAALNVRLAATYSLTSENVNQLMYLFLIIAFTYAVAHLVAGMPAERLTRWIDRAMRVSCGWAALVIAWHYASFSYGLWFPDGFFHSDVHVAAWDQGVAGIKRPSGSFSEPSAIAYAFAMFLLFFLQRWRATGRVSDQLWLMTSIAVLLFSTATTAYLILAAFPLLVLVDLAVNRGPGRAAREAVGRGFVIRARHLISIAAVLIVAFALYSIIERNGAIAEALLDEQLLNKGQSSSYEVRSTADRMAWNIVVETWGLGLGIGSHRPNSGALTPLIGAGIVGTIVLIAFLIKVLRPPRLSDPRWQDMDRAVRWGAGGMLMVHVIGAPELQSVPLWACLAVIIGLRSAGPTPHATTARLE